MNEIDLNGLKNLPTPEPSPGARDRAVEAALNAFDAEAPEMRVRTKGTAGAPRLISMLTRNAWSWIMERRVIAGAVAATVLMVPIALQYGWPQLKPTSAPAPQKTAETRVDAAKEEIPAGNGNAAVTDMAASRPAEPTAAVRMEFDAAVHMQEREIATSARAVTANEPAAATPPRPMMLGQAKRSYATSAERLVSVPPDVSAYDPRPPVAESGRDRFTQFESNPLKVVATDPVSTFSIDVDTASYAFVRRMLMRGQMPPRDAVRVEELINYFPYDYPRPQTAETPFRTTLALYPTPWNSGTRLLHIGIRGYDVVPTTRPRSNLVLLADVSGSMRSPDKLPLLKNAMRLLVDGLSPDDTVSIVTYAGNAGTMLEPTPAREKARIFEALSRLDAGGSTAGAAGIRQAYALAQQAFVKDGVNRVVLATDGDFNVGITDLDELKRYIEAKRKSGIFLSVLGFGQGNYNDALMQALAQNGNGNAAYIDTLSEARKVLVEEAGSTLFPIAKDVKIQVEFNPSTVSEYRLIGYETRALRREDFNNDKVDAGDIGSGHTVTALYEITPAGSTARMVDDLRYQGATQTSASAAGDFTGEYAFVKLRYKLPGEDTSKLITVPVARDIEVRDVASLGTEQRFAAAVAAFGQKLRGEATLADYGYDRIADLARGARGEDRLGYRSEFANLVRLAGSLDAVSDTGHSSDASEPAPR